MFAPGAALTLDATRARRRCARLRCERSASAPESDFLESQTSSTGGGQRRRQTALSSPRRAATSFNDHADARVLRRHHAAGRAPRRARARASTCANHYDSLAKPTAQSKGFYPYAVPLDDPSTPRSLGTNSTTAGLLPLSTAPLTWSNVSRACWTESVRHGSALPSELYLPLRILYAIPTCRRAESRTSRRASSIRRSRANVQFVSASISVAGRDWTLNEAQRRLEFSYGGLVIASASSTCAITAPQPSSWVERLARAQQLAPECLLRIRSGGYAIERRRTCAARAICFTIANTAAPNDQQARDRRDDRARARRGRDRAGAATGGGAARGARRIPGGRNAERRLRPRSKTKARTATFNDTPVACAAMRRMRGFTLVELAVALAVIGLLLGMLIVPLNSQIDQQRTNDTRKQLNLDHRVDPRVRRRQWPAAVPRDPGARRTPWPALALKPEPARPAGRGAAVGALGDARCAGD